MKHIAFLSVKWMSVGLGMLSLLLSVASCGDKEYGDAMNCLLYTSPSPRD